MNIIMKAEVFDEETDEVGPYYGPDKNSDPDMGEEY